MKSKSDVRRPRSVGVPKGGVVSKASRAKASLISTERPTVDVELASSIVSSYELSFRATVLLTSECSVVAANKAARHMAGKGLGLHVKDGGLSFERRDMKERLCGGLAKLISSPQRVGASQKPTAAQVLYRDRAVVIQLCEIVRLASRPLFLLQILDLNAEEGFQIEMLMDQGLTAREAQVALRLHSGETVASCAKLDGVAISTVRSHLRGALTKLNVNKQAQLVAKLAALFAQR